MRISKERVWLTVEAFRFWEEGQFTQAFEAFEELIKEDRNDADAWMGKGLALHGLGRFQEAIEAYGEAIMANKTYAKPWYNKALTYEEMQDIDTAILCCDNALRLDKNYEKAFLKRELLVEKAAKRGGPEKAERYKSLVVEEAKMDSRFSDYRNLSNEEQNRIDEVQNMLLTQLRKDKQFAQTVVEDPVKALQKYRLPSAAIYNLTNMAKIQLLLG